jgi:hypothetical protein
MEMQDVVEYDLIATSDLQIGTTYVGKNGLAGCPLAKLLKVGNQGGFRYRKAADRDLPYFVVLFTNRYGRRNEHKYWPDEFQENHKFIYYGDNRTPEKKVLDTKGNRVLDRVFSEVNSGNRKIPPFLIFDRPEPGNDVRFRGLAVPDEIPAGGNLEIIDELPDGRKIENFKARFLILATEFIDRRWLDDIIAETSSLYEPPEWREWVESTGTETKVNSVDELESFLNDSMRMSHIYQPLMIKSLLRAGSKSTIRSIALDFIQEDERLIRQYEQKISEMPLQVLSKHGVVSVDDRLVSLYVERMTYEEKQRLLAICDQKITEFISLRGEGIWG